MALVAAKTKAAKAAVQPHLHHVDAFGVEVTQSSGETKKQGSWCGLIGSLVAVGFIAWWSPHRTGGHPHLQ